MVLARSCLHDLPRILQIMHGLARILQESCSVLESCWSCKYLARNLHDLARIFQESCTALKESWTVWKETHKNLARSCKNLARSCKNLAWSSKNLDLRKISTDDRNVVIKVLLPCEVQQLMVIMYTAATCMSLNQYVLHGLATILPGLARILHGLVQELCSVLQESCTILQESCKNLARCWLVMLAPHGASSNSLYLNHPLNALCRLQPIPDQEHAFSI